MRRARTLATLTQTLQTLQRMRNGITDHRLAARTNDLQEKLRSAMDSYERAKQEHFQMLQHYANQLAKYCFSHADRVEIEAEDLRKARRSMAIMASRKQLVERVKSICAARATREDDAPPAGGAAELD